MPGIRFTAIHELILNELRTEPRQNHEPQCTDYFTHSTHMGTDVCRKCVHTHTTSQNMRFSDPDVRFPRTSQLHRGTSWVRYPGYYLGYHLA